MFLRLMLRRFAPLIDARTVMVARSRNSRVEIKIRECLHEIGTYERKNVWVLPCLALFAQARSKAVHHRGCPTPSLTKNIPGWEECSRVALQSTRMLFPSRGVRMRHKTLFMRATIKAMDRTLAQTSFWHIVFVIPSCGSVLWVNPRLSWFDCAPTLRPVCIAHRSLFMPYSP
jgi:hypothetical protein